MEISTYASTDILRLAQVAGLKCLLRCDMATAFLIFSAHFVQTVDEYSGVFLTESPRSWDIQCKLVQRPFLDTFSRRNFKQVFSGDVLHRFPFLYIL